MILLVARRLDDDDFAIADTAIDVLYEGYTEEVYF